jgi:molybdate transport repressor ModE-like protein
MQVELRLGGQITVNDREIAVGQTFAVLDAIAQHRSVRAAAERLGLSYRSVWGRVLSLEEALGRPLVTRTKGHGSSLTQAGEELRSALQAVFDKLNAPLAAEQRDLERRLEGLLNRNPARLSIAASHDPLLVSTLVGRSDVELIITGTGQAIDRLLAGAADVAGCHFGPAAARGEPAFPASLRDPQYSVRPVFVREQGLIVAPGNPLRIRSVADLVRTQARFVNRQKGSGTRAWFDRLLSQANLQASRIAGYDVEEFTHQAVGAVIASGAADAGLGVRAVAESFRLSFLPLGREAYYLATRTDRSSPVLEQIVIDLRSQARAALGYASVTGRSRLGGRGKT